MAPPTLVGGNEIVADAKRYLGIRYVFGGGPQNPKAGLDCSGLVERVAFDFHIDSCPRTSEEQFAWAAPVDASAYGPGDLVFFVGADGEPGSPGHVGIVSSAGKMINAPYTGTVVREDNFAANGTGVNQIVGFGRMQGSSASAPAASQNNQTIQMGETGGYLSAIFGGLVVFLLVLLAAGILLFLLIRMI